MDRHQRGIAAFILALCLLLPIWAFAAPVAAQRIYLPLLLKGFSSPLGPGPGGCPAYAPEFDFVTSHDVLQAPFLAEPAPRVWFRDPVFDTCVVRVTDRAHDLSPDDGSHGLKNEYSRVQSFNADGTRLLVRGIEATYYLYDASTLQPLRQLPVADEPRWDASDPNQLFFVQGVEFLACDVRDGSTRLVHDWSVDFPGQHLSAVWTRWEGSPSMDGRYWGFMADDESWMPVALLIYDRVAGRAVARRDLPDTADADSVTMSPLGSWLLVFWDDVCAEGELGSESNHCGLVAYDRNLTHARGLLRIVGHGDTALEANGGEVFVYQDIDTDHISMVDLATGQITDLWPIDFSHTAIGLHISGRALQRPGWVVVSTHDGDVQSHTWMDDQVFLLELKASGRLVRLAHTHSLVDMEQEHDYWAEPQASTNQDLTRVLFTTNWGRSGTEQVEMFMVALPNDWATRLP